MLLLSLSLGPLREAHLKPNTEHLGGFLHGAVLQRSEALSKAVFYKIAHFNDLKGLRNVFYGAKQRKTTMAEKADPVKTGMFGIRVSEDFRRRIQRAARFHKRKASTWAYIVIEDAVEAFEKEHPQLGHQKSAKGGDDA